MVQPAEPEPWAHRPGDGNASGQPPYGWGMAPGTPRFDPADPLISNDYAGWWQRGVAVLRAGWRPLGLLQLITVLPTLLLLVPVQVVFELAQRDIAREEAGGGTPRFGALLTPAAFLFLAIVLAGVVYLVGMLATVRMVVTVATGGRAGVGETLRSVLHRVPALIGWYLVAGLISVAALCACFLPVIYVTAVFAILPVVVLVERGGAVTRCFSLFHHDLGSAVARVATMAGVGIAIGVVFGGSGFLVSLATRGPAGLFDPTAVSTSAIVVDAVLGSVLNGAASVLSGVILTPLIVATYADLRARHEPFTTAHLVGELSR